MAIQQGTIITVLILIAFFYITMYRTPHRMLRISGCVGFMIAFGTLLMSASNNTEYAVSVMGILFSIGLAIVNFLIPEKKL